MHTKWNTDVICRHVLTQRKQVNNLKPVEYCAKCVEHGHKQEPAKAQSNAFDNMK